MTNEKIKKFNAYVNDQIKRDLTGSDMVTKEELQKVVGQLAAAIAELFKD